MWDAILNFLKLTGRAKDKGWKNRNSKLDASRRVQTRVRMEEIKDFDFKAESRRSLATSRTLYIFLRLIISQAMREADRKRKLGNSRD